MTPPRRGLYIICIICRKPPMCAILSNDAGAPGSVYNMYYMQKVADVPESDE